MSFNKEASIRYKIIDSCLRNQRKPFPSMDELMDACTEQLGKEFSISTIQKDIKAMKEDEALGFLAPIKFSKSQNGYYYEDKEYSISRIPLSESDIESLLAATDLLSTFSGDRVSSHFESAVDKILKSVQEKYERAPGKRSIIQLENPPKQRGYEHFDLFFRAAKERRPIAFVHFSYAKRKFSNVKLHVYLLKEFQNRWYIIGFSESHQSIRTFGIDRILDPALLKEAFYMDPKFDPVQQFQNIFGVFPLREKTEKIVFKVDAMLGNYMLSQPLHESQEVIEYGKYGDLLLKLELIPSQELIDRFCMWSSQLKVEKPLWIKTKIEKLQKGVNRED
jgi:predicted DNA-binding transcriptional regulator YafY